MLWFTDSSAAWIDGFENGLLRAVSPGKFAERLHEEDVPEEHFTGCQTST